MKFLRLWWSLTTRQGRAAYRCPTTVPTCLHVTGRSEFPGLSVHLKYGTYGTTVIPLRLVRVSLPFALLTEMEAKSHDAAIRPVQRHRPRHSRRRHNGHRPRPRLRSIHPRVESNYRRACIHLSLVRYQCTGAFDCGWEGCTEIHQDARETRRSRFLPFVVMGQVRRALGW